MILSCLLLALTGISISAQPLHIPIETPEQNKAFSEFNHHVAGFFLLAIGMLAFLSHTSSKLSFLGKVWPFLFILPGLYLAFMSDPDVWPMGHQTWLQAFQNNKEALQHKIYAGLLFALGIVEFQRERGKLGPFLAAWSFPVLAVFGAVLLFFHEHGNAAGEMAHSMPGMQHHATHVMTESMLKVQRQHLWFSIVGFGVALFKFISDGKFWKRSLFQFLWPACISVLGILLILYSE